MTNAVNVNKEKKETRILCCYLYNYIIICSSWYFQLQVVESIFDESCMLLKKPLTSSLATPGVPIELQGSWQYVASFYVKDLGLFLYFISKKASVYVKYGNVDFK